MKRTYLLSLFVFLLSTSLFGQVFHTTSFNDVQTSKELSYNADLINQKINQYDVFFIDISDVPAFQTGNNDQIEAIDIRLNAGIFNTEIQLYNAGLIPDGYTRITSSGNVVDERIASPMVGSTLEGYITRMTVNEGFLLGYIETADTRYYIESVSRYDDNASEGLYLIYDMVEAVEEDEVFCGSEDMESLPEDPEVEGSIEARLCYELEYALASDYKMYQKYGSVSNVENHMIAVTNNMQTNYVNDFVHEINYVIVETYIVDCSGCDPWSGTTDAGDFLSSFSNWARSSNGFSKHHDLASCWTNRNFNGGTVGIAWINTLCAFNRYNCLQDFTSNSNLLRVMTAHEIGHNFGYGHDASGSPYIMAPAVNNTNSWSSASISLINSKIQSSISGSCLEPCGVTTAPESDFIADVTEGCVPLTVRFTDLSTNEPSSWLWSFPGGTPQSSTQQNPTVVYNEPGVYNVTLKASNDFGSDTELKVDYITAVSIPTPDFTFITNELEVFFTNNSTGTNITGYLWDFGDGMTSTEENPAHIYTSPGTYTVSLTASNHCGDNTIQYTVIAVPIPIADFASEKQIVCEGGQIMFYDLSIYADQYEWIFEGGTPASSSYSNPVVTYNTPGIYDVTLTVYNHSGSDTKVNLGYVTVISGPIASFNSTVDGAVVAFENTSEGATSYHWDFGDGAESTETNPVHTYTSGGNFNPILTAFNQCGEDESIQLISITAEPQADFSADKLSACVGEEVNFSDLSQGAETYFWTFEGGTPSTSTEPNPVVTYSQAGTYNVSLTVENSTGSDSKTINDFIAIQALPSASFDAHTSGLTVTFSNTSENADAYHWDFGDGEESTEKNPQHTYSQGGSYTVTLTAINACGESEYTENIDLQPKPQANFAASIREGCAPLTVKFTSTSSDADSYAWTFEGGNPSSSTEANPTVIYESAGSYQVSLTVQNSTGQDTKTRQNYIVVHDTPIADFTAETEGLTVAFANSSVSATSYHWDFGDGEESTETNPIHTYAKSGEYTVILRAINDCGESSKSRKVGVGDYPNAEFEAGNRDGCVPLEVSFNNLYDGDISSYLWSFPGGSPSSSTESSPVVVYNAVGTYDVQLIVENGLGLDTVIKKDYIRVGDVAQSAFSWERSGLTVSFAEEVEGSYTGLRWEFGDGNTSTEASPIHTYGSYGRYDILLIAENACGKDTSHQELYFMHPATASFNVGALSGCAPLTVQMENTSTGDALEYKWHFPGGSPSTSSAMSPEVHYATPGVYNVELIAYNSESSDTLYREGIIEVYALPEVEFNFVVSGDTVYFTNLSKHGDGYLWSFGDGEESEEVDPVHYYEDGLNGMEVSLTVYNQCDTVTKRVKLDTTLPPVGKMDAESRKICVGTSLQFYDVSEGIVEVREWIFEGGTPERTSSQNPIVQYNETGRYDVTLIVSNGVGTDTLYEKDFIRVIDVPIAEFDYEIMGDSVRFLQRSEYGDEYRWDFGNGHRENSASPSIRYETSGDYIVELIVRNHCGADTIRKEISIITAVSSIPKSSVKVYPNPFTDQLTVEFSREISGPTELVVRDLSGRKIYASSYVIKGGDRVRLYLDDISAGLYILQLRNEGRMVHYKLIKQ